MRWKQEPTLGDKRVIKKFLLWPLVLKGEYRWLERAVIEQEWNNVVHWQSIRFLNPRC